MSKIQVTVLIIWAPLNPNTKIGKSIYTRRQNGHKLFNPILVFLVSYKFSAIIIKIMFRKLK